MSANPLGGVGEKLAARYLIGKGWTILHRNFRVGHKEIDLVAQRDGVVAFVEVKARNGDEFGHPLESITRRKRREIEEVASSWIHRFGSEELIYRFDAIAILRDGASELRVQHIEDAWGI